MSSSRAAQYSSCGWFDASLLKRYSPSTCTMCQQTPIESAPLDRVAAAGQTASRRQAANSGEGARASTVRPPEWRSSAPCSARRREGAVVGRGLDPSRHQPQRLAGPAAVERLARGLAAAVEQDAARRRSGSCPAERAPAVRAVAQAFRGRRAGPTTGAAGCNCGKVGGVACATWVGGVTDGSGCSWAASPAGRQLAALVQTRRPGPGRRPRYAGRIRPGSPGRRTGRRRSSAAGGRDRAAPCRRSSRPAGHPGGGGGFGSGGAPRFINTAAMAMPAISATAPPATVKVRVRSWRGIHAAPWLRGDHDWRKTDRGAGETRRSTLRIGPYALPPLRTRAA